MTTSKELRLCEYMSNSWSCLCEVAWRIAFLVCVVCSSLINILVVYMADLNIDVNMDEWEARRNEYYEWGSQSYDLSSGREWSARYGGYDKFVTLLPVLLGFSLFPTRGS